MVGFLSNYIKEGYVFSPMKEFSLTKSQRLFQRFAQKFGGSYTSISGFNNWVTNILPKQVHSRSFVSPDGVKVIFKDSFLYSPRKVIDGAEKLIYPQYCRSRKYPYTGRLTVTVVTIKPDGTTKTMEDITIGFIPIMLGSIKCNLHGMSREEMVKHGECISDPFGYFIISSERTVINIDKSTTNIPIITFIKKSPKHSIIFTYTARKRIILNCGKKWNSIQMDDPVDDIVWKDEGTEKRRLPIFIVYYILLGDEFSLEETIEKFILQYFSKEKHTRVKNALTETVTEFRSIKDPFRYLYILRNQTRESVFTDEVKEEIIESLERELFVEVFDHIENKKNRILAKLMSLSFIVARFVSFFIGDTAADDINSWGAKRFESPAVSMEILFDTIFNQVIKKCQKTQGVAGTIDYSAFGLKIREKSEGTMKTNLENSFTGENWGVQGTKFDRTNYSETTLRDTPLQLWSQIDKNNVNGASARGTKKETREVQPSQRNHHCVIETPESEQIGYVKHNAITNVFSVTRDKREISKTIRSVVGPYSERDGRTILITLNGITFVQDDIIGYGDAKTEKALIEMRRNGKLPFDVEIYKFPEFNLIDIQCGSSRPLAPYLIVNPETRELVIDEVNGWKWKLEKLLKTGCVEFLGPREEEKEENVFSVSVDNFYSKKRMIETSSSEMNEYYSTIYNFSHCNIDPNQVLSVSGSVCPFANHQLAPRSIFQAGMAKQALAFFNINYHLRYSATFKRLYKGTRPLTETMTYPIPSLDLFPSGQTAIVAFYATSDNQEDGVVVSEDYLNACNLNFITYKTIKYAQPAQTAGAVEKFQRPPIREDEDPGIYKNIQENGFPTIDSYIRRGDCVIAKVLQKKEGTFNNSIYAQMDEEGFVEAIEINRERDGQQILVKIRLRRYRKYQAGDKMALRYAQKGTIGRVAKREELLRVATGPNKGIVPDIIFNPQGFPSRQTVGLPIEGVINKCALYTGQRENVSSFQKYDFEYYAKILEENGMDGGGYEDMETSDGKRIPRKIGLVPLYEQALRHHVMDKIQMRDTGNKNLYTHQPLGGRTTGSGIRVGEMEKDSFVGHGASSVQVERMMKSSDEFRMVVCHNCMTIINKKICTACDNSDPGTIYIPYTFKLLIQLLNGVGIQIKIKTKKV